MFSSKEIKNKIANVDQLHSKQFKLVFYDTMFVSLSLS